MIKLTIITFITVCAGIWVLKKYVPEVKDSIKKTKDGDELRGDDSKSKKKPRWNYVDIFLFIITTVHLSCFAATILGFPGLLGPVHAILDENIGNNIFIFCVGMIPILIISIKYGATWQTARTWIIVANVILAIPTITLSYVPSLNPLYNQKIQQMQRTHLDRAASPKLHIKAEKDFVAYYHESKKGWKKKFKDLLDKSKTETDFTHEAGDFLEKGKKYYIANAKSQRSDGPHKLMSVYLPDKNGDVNAGSKIVWVRLDKEKGVCIFGNKIPVDTTQLQITPQISYGWEVDNKGRLVASLQTSEEARRIFRMSEGYSTPWFVLPPKGYRFRADYQQAVIVEEKGRGKKIVHPNDSDNRGITQGAFREFRFTALKGGAEIIITLRRVKV